MPSIPMLFGSEERANWQTPAYGYCIEHKADGAKFFIIGWDSDVTVLNCPLAGGTAVFYKAQVNHISNDTSAAFEKKTLAVNLWTQDERLRRYFVTAASVKIHIYVIRFASEILHSKKGSLNWGTDALLLNSGVIGNVAMSGQQIQCTVVPEPFLANQQVPRHYFELACNHVLYHPHTCKVNKAAHLYTAAIHSLDPSARIVTIEHTGGSPTYFRAGHLVYVPTGQMAGINWHDHGGPGGRSRLQLRVWIPQFEVGQNLTAYAGCNHTRGDCDNKFHNLPNFGGFPHVPDRNPTIHGPIP